MRRLTLPLKTRIHVNILKQYVIKQHHRQDMPIPKIPVRLYLKVVILIR